MIKIRIPPFIIFCLVVFMSLFLTGLQANLIDDLQYAILIGEINPYFYSDLRYQIDIAFFLIWLTYVIVGSLTLYLSRIPQYLWNRYLAD